jgi:hypothetical protein
MSGLAPVGGVPASTWRAARTCPRLLLVSEPNRSGKQISGRARTADPGPDGCTARSVAGADGARVAVCYDDAPRASSPGFFLILVFFKEINQYQTYFHVLILSSCVGWVDVIYEGVAPYVLT